MGFFVATLIPVGAGRMTGVYGILRRYAPQNDIWRILGILRRYAPQNDIWRILSRQVGTDCFEGASRMTGVYGILRRYAPSP